MPFDSEVAGCAIIIWRNQFCKSRADWDAQQRERVCFGAEIALEERFLQRIEFSLGDGCQVERVVHHVLYQLYRRKAVVGVRAAPSLYRVRLDG